MVKYNTKVYPTVYIRQSVLNNLQESISKLQKKTETNIIYKESEGFFDITGNSQQGCDEAEGRIIKTLLPKLNQSIDERFLKGTYKSLDIIRDEDLIGEPVSDEPEIKTVQISGQPAKLEHEDDDEDDDEEDKKLENPNDTDQDDSSNEMIIKTFIISGKVRSVKALLTSPPQQNMQNGDYLELVQKATGTECMLNGRSIQISGYDMSSVSDALDRLSVIQTTYLSHSKRMIVPCIHYPKEYDQSGLYFCRMNNYKQEYYVQENFFQNQDISSSYIILPVFIDQSNGQYGPPKDLVRKKRQQTGPPPPPPQYQQYQAEQQRLKEQELSRMMEMANLKPVRTGMVRQQPMRPSPFSTPPPSNMIPRPNQSSHTLSPQSQHYPYHQQQQPQNHFHTQQPSNYSFSTPQNPITTTQRTPTPSQRIPSAPVHPPLQHQRHYSGSSSLSSSTIMPPAPALAPASPLPPPSSSSTYDYSRPSSVQSSVGPAPSATHSQHLSDSESVSTLDEFRPPLWGTDRSFVNVYNGGTSPFLSREEGSKIPEVLDMDGFPLLPKLDEIPKRRSGRTSSRASSVRSERRVLRIVNSRSAPNVATPPKSPTQIMESYDFGNIKDALEEGLNGVRGFRGEVKLSAKLGKILWNNVDASIYKKIWDYTDIKDIIIHELHAVPLFSDCTTADADVIDSITDTLPSKCSVTATYEFHCRARNQPQVTYKNVVLHMNEGAIDLIKVSISESKLTEIDWISLDRKMDVQLALTTKELVRCDVKPYTTFMKWISVCPITRQMTFQEVPDFLYVDHILHKRTARYKALFPYIIEITRVEMIPYKQVKTTQFTKANKLQCQPNSGEVWHDVELVNPTHNLRFKSNLDLETGKVASWEISDILGTDENAPELRSYLDAIKVLIEKTEEALREGV